MLDTFMFCIHVLNNRNMVRTWLAVGDIVKDGGAKQRGFLAHQRHLHRVEVHSGRVEAGECIGHLNSDCTHSKTHKQDRRAPEVIRLKNIYLAAQPPQLQLLDVVAIQQHLQYKSTVASVYRNSSLPRIISCASLGASGPHSYYCLPDRALGRRSAQ